MATVGWGHPDAPLPGGAYVFTLASGADGAAGGDFVADFAVFPDNRPPETQDAAATVAEDGAVLIDVLANDEGPDGDPLTIVGGDAFTALGGRVVVAGDGLSLSVDYGDVDLADLEPGETRVDTVDYVVSDGDAARQRDPVADADRPR